MIRKALESYATERQPWQPEKNSAYLDSMGWVLFKLGRYDEARKHLEEAVADKEGSDDGTIVDHLGDVYLQLNERAKAKEMWTRAKELMQQVEGPRREDQKIKEIEQKLKELDRSNTPKSETKRQR
jgi:tetratricopeptide (TPR) repeat protein